MRIFLGNIAIFGIYFLVKCFMFLPLTIVPGIVESIATKEEVINTPKGPLTNTISYPVITFRDAVHEGDTGSLHTLAQEEVMSFSIYTRGMPVQVAYDPANVAKAKLYSVSEFWFPVSIMLILVFACLAWTAGFVFVNRFRKEGR